MVMLIAGGSLSTGSHDPYCGTLMPLGPSTPSVGVNHKPRTNRRFLSILRGSAQQENPPVAVGDIFIRKTANSDRLLDTLYARRASRPALEAPGRRVVRFREADIGDDQQHAWVSDIPARVEGGDDPAKQPPHLAVGAAEHSPSLVEQANGVGGLIPAS